jgi:tripartite-type tricarboxylate transporter receptor subunit TctC
VLIANGALPMHSVKDLVEAAKQKPDGITYGSVGVGSSSHLAGVMLEDAAHIKWQHVPYRGTVAA